MPAAPVAPGGMPGPELTERLAPPPRLRRRPALVAASVATVCVGALLAVWAYSSLSTAQSVLAVRTTVHRGEVISRDELVTVQVGVDPALSPVSSGQLGQVVGRRAALDLPAGALLTGEAVTDAVVPAAGLSVVGVALTAAQMPSTPLTAGDQVRIVTTPGQQGDVGAGVTPETVSVTVVSVQPAGDSSATAVVNVSVPSGSAARLAAQVATGRVALVLDSRER